MTTLCILCPKGCSLTVNIRGETLDVTGNNCPKGIEFAQQEWFHPERMLTTTVKTNHNKIKRIPVRTTKAIPKERLMDVMKCVNACTVELPIVMGTVIIENVLELGVDIIATLSMKED